MSLFRSLTLALAAPSLLLFSGCTTNRVLGGAEGVTLLREQSSLPEPTGNDLVKGSRPYLIGPFDKLSVDVFGIPELSRDVVRTDANGTLSLPLVGTINATGKTPSELEQEIERGLRASYVRNPQVNVNLVDAVSQVVTVDGQVGKPGQYPVVGKMTLLRTIANAGGTGEFARLDDVIIFRTVDKARYAGVYNLKAIREGNYIDPEVFANDVVVVGDSPSRRRFKDIIQAAPLLTTPLLILFR